MKKVSFDFDGVLEYQTLQLYAKELIDKGVDVWICSARFIEDDVNPTWNDDIYGVANDLGIPKTNIILTQFADKHEIFENTDFIWHLDDSFEEADNISEYTSTVGIRYYSKGDWKNECNKLLWEN